MGNIIQETTSSDEVNLFKYFKIIRKRKRLLLGIFLASTLGTTAVNLFLPKIYREELIVKVSPKRFGDVLNKMNVNATGKVKNILPKTYQSVNNIELTALSDTMICKVHIQIDTKDTSAIAGIITELFEYINNLPFCISWQEQEKERLEKELHDVSNAISYMQEAVKAHDMLLKSEKFIPENYKPVKAYNALIALKKKKVIIEQALKNNNAVELLIKDASPVLVGPQIKRNVILSALIGILAGIFFVFIAELREKLRTKQGE